MEIDRIILKLRRLGYQLNYHITVMPEAGTPSERKRHCTRRNAHAGQALTRPRDKVPHIAITFFEHSANTGLHAHQLLFVPPTHRVRIEKLHSPPEVHVECIDDLDGLVKYVTKERRHFSPEFEKEIKRPWRSSKPIPGKRWTMTIGARKLSAED